MPGTTCQRGALPAEVRNSRMWGRFSNVGNLVSRPWDLEFVFLNLNRHQHNVPAQFFRTCGFKAPQPH